MEASERSSEIISVFTWVALGVLAIVVAVCSIGIAGSGELLVTVLPDLGPTLVPLTVLALMFAACVEILIVVTGILVAYVHAGRIFRPSALRLVDTLVVTVVVATVLVVAALFFIPGPPQLFVLVEASVPLGATFALVLLVLRRLLSRTVAMHRELEEVV